MQGVPAFGGRHLPMRGESVAEIATALEQTEAQILERLATVRNKLLDARRHRVLPVDDKELAGWNGLMLAAFATAAQRWEDPQFRAAARRIRDLLRNRLWDGSRLRRALAGADEIGKASLADYAYAAYGMWHYAKVSGDPADRTFFAALIRSAWQRFHGDGGWQLDDDPLIPVLGAQAAMSEGALPAPSAVIIRLSLLSEDARLRGRAVEAAQNARQKAQTDAFWYAGHHAALLQVASGVD